MIVQIVTCKSPEGVDLALSEFWTLSDLSNNENILKFSEAYLEFKGEFEILKHGDHLNSDRYRHLVEVNHVTHETDHVTIIYIPSVS